MSTHKHEYRRLSDVAVFCAGCGDIKTAQVAMPVYPYYPARWWPYTPPPTPYVWPTVYWGTTTSDPIGSGASTFDAADPNVTYTLSAGGN